MKKILLVLLICMIPCSAFTQNNNTETNRNLGMYIGSSYGPGLNWSFAIGFSFFDEMLKFQINFYPNVPSGQNWENSGFGISAKAIGAYNFSYYESFLTTSLGLGFEVGYFVGDYNSFVYTLSPMWEFIKIDMSHLNQNWRYLNTFSMFVEYAFIAIADPITSWRFATRPIFGSRLSLF